MTMTLLRNALRLLALSALALGPAHGASGRGSDDATAVSSSLVWGRCAFSTFPGRENGAECATLTVPACYDGSCSGGDTPALPLTVYRRRVDDSAPNVWALFTTVDETGLAAVGRLVKMRNVNVYALQSRGAMMPVGDEEGVYFSDAPCAPLVSSSKPPHRIDAELAGSIDKCRRWIEGAFGANGATAYSLDSAAKDLALAMSLGDEGAQPLTYVYAMKNMTRTVQRFMEQNEDREQADKYSVSGYSFDHPVPMKLSAAQDTYDGNAFDRFLSFCSLDETCHGNYSSIGMTMPAVLGQLLTTLDASPEMASVCLSELRSAALDMTTDMKPSRAIRRLLSSYASASRAEAKALAPLLFRIHRCTDKDLRAVRSFSAKPQIKLSEPAEIRKRKFVDTLIEYSELWPNPVPSQDELVKSYETTRISPGNMIYGLPSYCAYTASDSVNCQPFYKGSTLQPNASLSLVYKKPTQPKSVDSATGFMGSSTADVLVLTSRLSTSSTVEVAEQLYAAFAGSKSTSSGVDRSIILVVSDNFYAPELTGDAAAVVATVVERFLMTEASAWSGKWYVSDLAPPISSLASTYENAPLNVNLTVGRRDVVLWIDQTDPYGVWKPAVFSSGDWSISSYLYIAIPVVGIFLLGWISAKDYLRRRELRRQAAEDQARARVEQEQFEQMYALAGESVFQTAPQQRGLNGDTSHQYDRWAHPGSRYEATSRDGAAYRRYV